MEAENKLDKYLWKQKKGGKADTKHIHNTLTHRYS